VRSVLVAVEDVTAAVRMRRLTEKNLRLEEANRDLGQINEVAPPQAFRNSAEADGLSERELEVLLMVARGMSNHQIAVSLHLSEATIKRHLANIYPRIGVSSRGEAVRKALSKKWISPLDITSEQVH
jgi:ATP/maltotriose-dependent transcriptional regulator MalT